MKSPNSIRRSRSLFVLEPSTRHGAAARGSRTSVCPLAALCTFLLSSTISPAQTWSPVPLNNNWNDALNWLPPNVPDSAGESALFAVSAITNPAVTNAISIEGIIFNPGALAYSISNEFSVALNGTGIVNNSGLVQTITNNFGSPLDFNNSASAGSLVVINNSSAAATTNFFNTSTAGTATINNSSATGLVNFLDNATAGNSIINNSASAAFPSSVTAFFGTSTAGNAAINNSGDNTQTLFSGNSTAGASTITNSGTGSSVFFVLNTTAGSATINNSGANSFADFNGNSSAGTATINNSGALSLVDFFNDSTAANATINLTNATALLSFFDNATAANAIINNDGSGPFPGSVVGFFGNSTAGNAAINNSGDNTQTLFSGDSTAGASTITNSGAGSSVLFLLSTTAGSATINNSGANSFADFDGNSSAGTATINSSGALSLVDFFDNSTAANSTINLTNATALLSFFDNATAANAIINNDGSGPFPGSVVGFFGSSTAANAAINNSGDNTQTFFSGNSTAGASAITNSGAGSSVLFLPGTTAGSATINNSGLGSFADFEGNSSAGTATINNSGALSLIDFFDSSTAANATLNLTNATALLSFFDTATAANAIINNNGSGPFPSSVVTFFNNSTAANAAITNGGSNAQTLFTDSSNAADAIIINSGDGSSTAFAASASGGRATLINANSTSIIDISQLTTGGIEVGSVAGNGALRLGSKSLTVGNTNASTEFSGIIQDGGFDGGIGGSLIKIGSGTFILSGANTFTGGTTLQSGTIVVASAQALGTGDFLLNSGTLRASGPTRDINVGGNYTQTGGELALRIGGSADGQYDRLSVLGSASLAGRLRVDSINGFQPVSDDRFILVNANGGRTGVFSEFDDNLSDTALRPTLTYTANQVILEYLQGAFLPFALTPNQTAVARTLDAVVNDAGAADLIAFLDTLPVANLPAAFDLIAPEEIGTIFEITRSAAKAQAFHVQRRLDEIHQHAPAPPEEHFSKDGKSVVDGKTSKAIKTFVPPEPRWGLWATGSGEFVSVGDTFNARGYEFDSGGITFGLDYKFSDHFAAGVLFNYTRTEADLTGGGNMDVDAARGGIYASVFGSGAYLNAYVGGGWFDFDSHRDGLEGRVRGETDGGEFNALVAAGYDAHFGNLTVGPIASYQYTYTGYSSFSEEGSLAPLRISSTEGESSRTNVGLRLSYACPIGSVIFKPEVRATWQHEFGDSATATKARFGFGGPEFNVHSAEVGEDSAVLTGGFSVLFSPTVSAYAFYEGELGRENYEAHNVFVGARVSF